MKSNLSYLLRTDLCVKASAQIYIYGGHSHILLPFFPSLYKYIYYIGLPPQLNIYQHRFCSFELLSWTY